MSVPSRSVKGEEGIANAITFVLLIRLRSLQLNTLTCEEASQLPVQLELIIDAEMSDDCLQYRSDRYVVLADDGRVVDVGKEAHEESVRNRE
jgi:hypothetical protein